VKKPFCVSFSIRTTMDTSVRPALKDGALAVEAIDQTQREPRKASVQAEEAPSGFEPLYEALQASA
jgi:hypothetical protein